MSKSFQFLSFLVFVVRKRLANLPPRTNRRSAHRQRLSLFRSFLRLLLSVRFDLVLLLSVVEKINDRESQFRRSVGQRSAFVADRLSENRQLSRQRDGIFASFPIFQPVEYLHQQRLSALVGNGSLFDLSAVRVGSAETTLDQRLRLVSDRLHANGSATAGSPMVNFDSL